MRASDLLALWLACCASPAFATSIPVRVVVVTTFELGQDRGDAPGEFQAWVERLPLSQEISAPGTYHQVMRYNPDRGRA
jgi:purine nucleoside permease